MAKVLLGSQTPIPNKTFPNKSFTNDANFSLVLTEKEKKKDDFNLIKRLVNNHEETGRQQITANKDSITKMFNLANGVIDKRDYIKGETDHKSELEMMGGENLEYDLEFYPIIPNIVNVIDSFPSKTSIRYSAMAVNREAQNEIIEQKNSQIRNLLVSKAFNQYNGNLEAQGITPETQPDVYQEQIQIFQALPKIQKYYNTEFRLTIEQWSNHRLKSDEKKHSMKELDKKALHNRVVCDRPFVHINLQDSDYRPEVLKPDLCAWLKSPYLNDVSEGYMFMWLEYDNPVNLIQRFGDKMSKDDIKKLEGYYNTTRFTATDRSNYQFEKSSPIEASVQNFLAFRSETDTNKHRGDEYRDNLIEVMNMYLQVPRKLYALTMISDDKSIYTTLVSEDYKVTFTPQYIQGKPKIAANLIYGEHLEPFYKNELWRVIKLNFSRNPNPDLSDDIWVMLEKYPIQFSSPLRKYGSLIPVHGGPTSNEYSSINSIVKKCESWQIFYNYLWNRASQLLQTEIGIFFMMNQNVIPQESMGESWGKHNVAKWLLTARDTSLAPVDVSPTNTGQSNLGATGGFGQKVDLTRTDEVLQKIKLAEIIKSECLSVVGISPQLLGDISPNETATGTLQGINRSIASLKNIYDAHFSMMEKVRQTMLECAKYLAIQGDSIDETYINDEGERVIFQTNTENFALYQMGVYVSSDFDDNLLKFEINEMVKRDNTMGADALDKVLMLSGGSTSDIISQLKELKREKERMQQAQQNQINQIEQAKITSQEKIKEAQMQWEKEKLVSILESEEKIANIKVIGQSQFAQGGGVEELIKLEKQDLNEREHYQSILDKSRNRQLTQETNQITRENASKEMQEKSNIEDKRFQLEREKIMAKLKIAETELAIARENKP